MKAIITKSHGSTDTKGSRISASDLDGNRVMLTWDHELSGDKNHERAAYALCDKMNWRPCKLVGGAINCHQDMAWVFAEIGPDFGSISTPTRRTGQDKRARRLSNTLARLAR